MIFEIFKTFFKIGAFAFGGGYGMIPIVQDEIVGKRKWIDEEEFLDAMAVAQGAPGAMAVNVSIYVGYKLKGVAGALAAVLGSVLPSFFIMIIIGKFFYQYRNNPLIDRAFLGIRPAVVGLILSAVYSLTKSAKLGYRKLAISVLTVLLIAFLDISPIYLVIAGGLGSILINKLKKE